MSLGDSNRGNGSNKKMYENTYYSRLGFKEQESGNRLGFNFRNGMIVIEISKLKDGGAPGYDLLNGIFVTPAKARLLDTLIDKYEEAIANGTMTPGKGYGINAGMGETQSILILGVDEKGAKTVTIGKVDVNGSFTSKTTFTFNTNYYYGLNWSNVDKNKVEKEYVEDVEFSLFKDTIKHFAIASTDTYAYAHADITRYDLKSILNKMNPIYDKLGIEKSGSGSWSNNSAPKNNYFSNNNSTNTSSEHKSYEDLENDLHLEEDE